MMPTETFVPAVHHKMSIRHLLRKDEAVLLAGMGLGKTACVLTAFHGLQVLGDAKAMLVVAPIRVAALTWPNEIEKWPHLRHLKYADLRTKEGMRALERGTADVYLINYEQLPKFAKKYLRKNRVFNFDTVVFDELTAAKNHNSKRINIVRQRLVNKRGVVRRWGLTGTPTPNSLMELFAQIRLIDGGKRLGTSFSQHRNAFFYPEDYMEYTWLPKPGAKRKIYERIADIALSLPSEEFSGIPIPQVIDVEMPLPEDAKEMYEELERDLVLLFQRGQEVVAQTAATLVNKLLQLTGGTVYDTEGGTVKIHRAKLDALHEILDKEKGPVIIVTNYIHERKRILKSVPDAEEFQDSKQFLARWNAGKIPVLVTHARSLSHGLNMQYGGHVVIWFSLTWSRETYDQLNARLARSGQKNRVRIYRLLCSGTIDDAVAETLRQKESEQRALMTTLRNFKRLAA